MIISLSAIAAACKGRGLFVQRTSTRFVAALLLTFGLVASAQAQVMNFTGASPSTFTGPGQVITFSLTFNQSNAITQSISLNNMNYPGSALSCAGLPLAPNGSTTCTFTYTTTAANSFDITEFGMFTALDPNNIPRSGNISNQQVVPLVVATTPSASMSLSPGTVLEDGASNLVYTVTLSQAATAATTVNITTGGSAISGTDYTGGVASVTIPNGGTTGTITINPTADTVVEPNETVTLTIAAGTGYTVGAAPSATGTIVDDDTPNLSINDVAINEGNVGTSNATFTISLSAPAPAGGVTFNIATADNTATGGIDYVGRALSGQTIPAGSTTYSFAVVVDGDPLFENNESFFVNVNNVAGAIVVDGQGLGTINNDDTAPTVSINNASVTEGNSGTVTAAFTVGLSAASGLTTTINYATANVSATAGSDYTATSGTLTFNPGVTTQPVNVTVNGDNTPEANETFNVVLSSPSNATIGTGTGVGTITNDDTPVTVNPGSLPAAFVASAYSQTVTGAGGNNGPYVFTITAGSMPAGLTLSSAGVLSGTPTASGTFNFTIKATDSSGAPGPYSGTQAYTLTVNPPAALVLPATALAGGTLGSVYSAALNPATGGTAPYSYARTGGALPGGVTLSSAGVLGGTPTALGTFNFTVTATDSTGGAGPYTASQSYSIVVIDNPPIAGAVSATVAFNSGANPITLNLSGGTAVSVAIGTAPAHGTANASGTSITYQPSAGYAGSDSFTYTATNSGGTSAPATVTITVSSPTITVTPSGGFAATVGIAYSQTFTWAGGTAPYGTYVVSGLPAGVAITGSSSNSVTVSGTPTAAGSFALTATATDSSTGTGPFTVGQPFTLSVAAPTLVLAPASTTFTTPYAAPYSQAFTASGGIGPYSYALTSGALPAGVSFTSAGLLSGTPTAPGNYSIAITATDTGSSGLGAPFAVTSNYTLAVTAPTIVITPATLPGVTAGTAYSQTLSASGAVAPYSYALSAGSLPPGISLSSAGAVSGTPTSAGSFNFTVTATDANSQTGSIAYTVVVAVPVLTLTPATVPGGTANTAYSQTFSTSGGIAPYTYSLSSGALPPGISFSSAGVLSGTATSSGTFNFAITVTDSTGGTAATTTSSYALVIAAPTLTLIPASLATGVEHVAYSQTFTASGGIAPYSYAVTSGSLPPGLALNASSGVLSGAPNANGSYTFAITATDSTGGTPATITQSYTVLIALRPDPSKDAEVLGMLDAQVASTRRFAEAQIGNFRSHLESLHDGGSSAGGIASNLSFSNANTAYGTNSQCLQPTLTHNVIDCPSPRLNDTTMRADDGGSAPKANNDTLFNLWAGGVIRTGDRDDRIGRSGFDFESDGVSLGADYRVDSSFVMGAGIGVGHDNTDVGHNGSRVDGNAYTAALYSSFHPASHFYLDSLIAYQWLSYDLKRFITSTGGQAIGKRDGNQWFVSLSAGGEFQHGGLHLAPYARWDYARANLDAYTELGDPVWTLHFNEQHINTSTLNLGLRMDWRHLTNWGAFSPQFRVEYQHDLNSNGDALLTYADSIAGPVYRASLLDSDKNRLELGLAGLFELANDWNFRVEYRHQQSSNDQSQAVQLNVEKKF